MEIKPDFITITISPDMLRSRKGPGPFRAKLDALEVGRGFEVTDAEGENVSRTMNLHARETGKRFARKKLGPNHYLVYRIA